VIVIKVQPWKWCLQSSKDKSWRCALFKNHILWLVSVVSGNFIAIVLKLIGRHNGHVTVPIAE